MSATSSFHSPANSSSSFRRSQSSPPPPGLQKQPRKKETARTVQRKYGLGSTSFNKPSSIAGGKYIETYLAVTFGKSPPLLRFLCPGGEMQKTAAATPTWKRGKVQFEKKKRRNKSNPFHAEDKSSGCRIRGRGNFVHRCAFGSVSSSSSSSFGNCNFLPQNASFLRRSLPPRPPARSGKNSSGTVATVIGPQSDPLRPTEEEEGDRDHESIYIPTW